MKKIIAFATILFALSTVFASPKSFVTENDDGSVLISNIDENGEAVKYNQTFDGFNDVTVIDGKKVTTLNPAFVSLAAYGNKDLLIDFSVDVRVDTADNSETDVMWMINEFNANFPVVAREKISSGKWVTMKGSLMVHITEKKQFYISSSGMNLENMVFYLKNFKLHLAGEGISKQAAAKKRWIAKDVPALKDVYNGIFDYFGLAVVYRGELDNPNVRAGIAKHAKVITMGNEFKPDFVMQKSSKFTDFVGEDGNPYPVIAKGPNFSTVREILQICKENNLQMRGHVLVWHSQTPSWFFRQDYNISKPFVTKEEMNARMEWYIKSMMEFVDKWEKENNDGKHIVVTWDVVNEAVADGATAAKYLREGNSNWFKIYGDGSFIVNAFRYANKYAPKDVELVYNDYSLYSAGKLNGLLKVIDMIQAAPDARLDAVGMQSHIKVDYPAVSGPNSYEEAIQKILSKNVNIQITELDIANGKAPYSPLGLKLRYKEIMEMYIRNRKMPGKKGIEGVTIWGLKDEGTWLDNQPEYKGYKQYPVLFEDDYYCKPAFFGVLEAAESVK